MKKVIKVIDHFGIEVLFKKPKFGCKIYSSCGVFFHGAVETKIGWYVVEWNEDGECRDGSREIVLNKYNLKRANQWKI